ncbi:Divalent-cation tolerance protein CutA [Candidatus Magnetaquicoccaceae bacterium FCR-1]|uniref:Divalent-cation tolerance protein CutA n=1 Tax=Candidatus Magnetaquiglobus chichijimensis TaxID=3141448 RepID=A0ABQ0CBZ2_9PROT
MTDALVVVTTAPDEAVAESLAEVLVTEGLAACVHILPAGRSIYRWQGEVHKEPEWTLLIKTDRARFAPMRTRLLVLHPYEVPEILALPVEDGNPAYLAWLKG